MGKTLSILSRDLLGYKTIFSKRISIESAETFHVHYRNLRLEFNKENFEVFAKSIIKAYDNYLKNKGKKVPGQTFLELSTKINTREIISADEIKIELCENLYTSNKNSIFGKNAEFYNDDLYFHIHYRDLRIEMSLSEFHTVAKGFVNAYLNRFQNNQGNTFDSILSMFQRINANNIEYLVMRNWEDILLNNINSEHPDIDLLISPADIPKFDFLTQSAYTNLETYRVQRVVLVKIHNKATPVLVDLRTTTDCYYPESLAINSLKSRRRKKFIYTPDDKHFFLTLLYHSHFHKHSMNEGYIKILRNVYRNSWFNFDLNKITDKSYVIKLFEKLSYPLVEPFDKSVQYNPD